MADYTILIEDLDVAMRLGIHSHEMSPQRVRLAIELTVSYPVAIATDAIDEVLDYDFVRDGIRALAAGPGFALQETLVDAVAALCLRDPRVQRVRVRSTKLDIYPDAKVGCEVVRAR